ncbi:MAG: DUF2304 domain-containing protein [Clostridiales bacterium]|nr:DUF2304 domain-containing protein [Clostridiales bacterium]
MSITLRVILLVAAIVTTIWILWQIRKHKVKLDGAIFWILFSIILIVIGIFPELTYKLSTLIGVVSPANLVFLVIIFLLLEKIFSLSLVVSQLQDKIEVLSAEIALLGHRNKDKSDEE